MSASSVALEVARFVAEYFAVSNAGLWPAIAVTASVACVGWAVIALVLARRVDRAGLFS